MSRIASMVLATALLTAALLASAGAASAQVDQDAATEEEARTTFQLAMIHYNSGRFAEAAQGFQRAYELSGRPALLYNLYLANRDDGDLQGAHDALGRYLEEAGDAVPNRQLMERRLETLQRQIVSGATGPSDTATTDPPDGSTTPATDPPAGEPQADDPSSGGGSALPWVVVGAGGAMLVAALIFNRLSVGEHSDLDDNCPDDLCPAAYDAQGVSDTIELYSGLAWGFLAAGVVAAGTGVSLMLLSSDDGEEPTISAACGPDGCTAGVRGRF